MAGEAGRDKDSRPAPEQGTTARSAERGRRATRPSEIPKEGWKDILLRVKSEVVEDNLSIIAAGVAFYAFLSIFPALAAMVSIYGLIVDPAQLQQHVKNLEAVLPAQAAEVLNEELSRLATQDTQLGWGLIFGVALALWSASKGMKSMFQSMNVAYDEKESRGFVRLNATALLLTLGAILLVTLCLVLIAGVPVILQTIGLGALPGLVINLLRWPILALLAIFGLAVLYRYGPSRNKPQWKWISWGAVIATVLWLVGSAAFSFYVANFGNYNKTYGSLGVVVVLMMWVLLSVYSVLLGAEINAEMEHQTTQDTTEGDARPMGERDAHVADTVGSRP